MPRRSDSEMFGESVALPVAFVCVVFFYVMVPILVLIHELGHAAAAVRTGKRPVVVVGKVPPLVAHRFRRFDLFFHPRLALDYFYPRTPTDRIPVGYVGECRYDPDGLTVDQERSIIAAGPHASLIAGLAFAAIAWLLPVGSIAFWLAAVTGAGSFFEGLANLIPSQHDGRLFSDGARMARLRGLDGDEVLAPSHAPSR